MPPLVGWAAATGKLSLTALALFAIIPLDPPALLGARPADQAQLRRREDPMLPVVRGDRVTTRQILAYWAALVAATLAPVALDLFGLVYLVAAAALGAVFLYLARQLHQRAIPGRAAALFHSSLLYLALLFSAIGADAFATPA
jgi:protoheme IX farnesyltransferase